MYLSATICVILILATIAYFSKKFQRILRIYKYLRKLPGPLVKNIFIGNLWYLQTEQENILNKLIQVQKDYYPIFYLGAMLGGSANILTPEDTELILSNSVHNEKGFLYILLDDWLKTGLLTSKNAKWQTRRKILTPAFHFNILQQFMPIFNDESDELVKIITEKCEDSSTVDVSPLVSQFTLKTIAETAMGTKFQFYTEKDAKYKHAIWDIGKILLYRLLRPWFIHPALNYFSPRFWKERKTVKILHKYTREVIESREKNFKEVEAINERHDVYTSRKRMAMLDLLLSAKKNEGTIDNDGIQEEVDTFMFEGHDTTGVALGFLLMLIACHQDCQAKILEEMKSVLGDLKKKPNYNELQNLKYMEKCIKESLRIYPSVYFIVRTLGEDLQTHSGYFLPKGTDVSIHIYAIHHDSKIYSNPEEFQPERFSIENSQNRHPFAYLPFSAGPRNCIGQKFAILELKAAVCAVLAKFKLEPVDTPDTIVLLTDIVLRTAKGIKVKFVPRC